MIFNLNEQKVLSDPSGSSVFKGEKDFNDIVVNLPDTIDGHTAAELNYVMHFVDSDGGYSTKILTVDSSGKTLKATATVSTNITSKAQAFYAYVLMTDDEETVIGKTNGVIVMIHPVPDEENEIIPPADADKIIKGLEEIVKEATDTIEEATEALEKADNYNELKNKPSINNVTLSGNKSSDDLSLQSKLTAGENITIENNVISAEGGGVTSYNDLTDKPYVSAYDWSGTMPQWPITGTIEFEAWQFYGMRGSNGKIKISLDNEVSRYHSEPLPYDFNRFSAAPYNGCLEIQHSSVSNFPSALNKIDTSKPYFLTQHFNTKEIGNRERHAFRKVSGYSRDGDFIEYAQICYINYMYWLDNEIISQTDWVELTGGSQIVSGTVNNNGTITFTDSDGNTFTTTGASVIGEDGFSPVATVTQTASGATVSITDSTGTTTANISNGQDGNDYVLTAQDKSDIADIVLSELPNADTMSF